MSKSKLKWTSKSKKTLKITNVYEPGNVNTKYDSLKWCQSNLCFSNSVQYIQLQFKGTDFFYGRRTDRRKKQN